MNWYKHYIGDYQRDTGHLSMVEHGAYRLMLDTHYATEAPLPKTNSVLFRLLRAFTEAEQEAVVAILSQYWTETPGGYVNDRSGREFEKYTNKINTARENGNRGGRPKKTHDITETQTETITETEPATKAPQIPDNQKEDSEPNGSGADAPRKNVSCETTDDPMTLPLSRRRVPPDTDWRKMLFDHGLPFLVTRYGGKPDTHRPLMGRWLKDSGDNAKVVYDALADAQDRNVADVRAWVVARIKPEGTAAGIIAKYEKMAVAERDSA